MYTTNKEHIRAKKDSNNSICNSWFNFDYIYSHVFLCMQHIFPAERVFYKFDNNIKNYLQSGEYVKKYADYVLPELADLPDYKDIEYQYFRNPYNTLGIAETMLLVVTYDKNTYEDEKTKLDSSFTFLDHIVVVDGYNYMPEYEFAINSYDFRVVDRETKNTFEYPNSFGMVATSDENCSIAYMYFWDLEIDYVGKKGKEKPKMQEFVQEYFRYEW